MPIFDDNQIIYSWNINATAWIDAIKNCEIESRILITNNAIINVITKSIPKYVLDLGCGEGWLTHELTSIGIRVLGLDGVDKLIQQAKINSHAEFNVCSYEKLSEYYFAEKFDCIVCNFSLIGKESTDAAIATSTNLLQNNGRFIIQTLHPVIACNDLPYVDGWRTGTWAGFSKDFTQPAPWYFRTLESWSQLLNKNGFKNIYIYEPIHPKSKKPASIIFECHV